MMEITKSIVLVGMPGAGKSSVGYALTKMVQAKFLDSDMEVEGSTNKRIVEIFAQHGESYFRKKEQQVIQRLLSSQPIILSTGGGAYINRQTQGIIDAFATSVWLKVDFGDLWNRIKNNKHRPLLQGTRAREQLKQQFQERTPIYAKAHMMVYCKDKSVHQIAHAIVKHLSI